ncbi:MAG: hypothetical protein ACI32N_03735 [Bulleidia sp.]
MKYDYLVLSCFLILTGCTSVSKPVSDSVSVDDPIRIPDTEDTFQPVFTVSDTPLRDGENISASFVNGNGFIPYGEGDGFVQTGTAIRYCNPQISDTFAYYCSRSGCHHTDQTCNCYIGSAELFLAYRDRWYYDRINQSGEAEIVEHDPSNNTRNVIGRYETEADGSVEERVQSMLASEGKLYVTIERHEWNSETGEEVTTYYVDVIHPDEMKRDTILKNDGDLSLFGVRGNRAVVVRASFEESVNGQPDPQYELRIYDINTGNHDVITDTEDGFRSFSDHYQLMNHDDLVYVRNQEIHVLNLTDMTDTIVYTASKKVIRAWFFGSNIFFLQKDENSTEWLMISPDGSMVDDYSSLLNENQVMRLGYSYLTDHGQIGRYLDENGNLKNVWISEDDLLHCRLENMIGA